MDTPSGSVEEGLPRTLATSAQEYLKALGKQLEGLAGGDNSRLERYIQHKREESPDFQMGDADYLGNYVRNILVPIKDVGGFEHHDEMLTSAMRRLWQRGDAYRRLRNEIHADRDLSLLEKTELQRDAQLIEKTVRRIEEFYNQQFETGFERTWVFDCTRAPKGPDQAARS